MIEYIKRKDALHILELVVSDENITHKYKAIRKRLKALPSADVVELKKREKIKAIEEFARILCEDKVSNDPVVIEVMVALKMMREGAENG